MYVLLQIAFDDDEVSGIYLLTDGKPVRSFLLNVCWKHYALFSLNQ